MRLIFLQITNLWHPLLLCVACKQTAQDQVHAWFFLRSLNLTSFAMIFAKIDVRAILGQKIVFGEFWRTWIWKQGKDIRCVCKNLLKI